MRVCVYTDKIALEALRWIERPDPVPGDWDVLIRIRAVGLNNRDLAIAAGRYHVGVSPPLVPASDGLGEVIATGCKVSRFKVGDYVCPTYLPDWINGPVTPQAGRRRLGGPTDGVLAELVCVNENDAVRAPRNLTAIEAATLPVTGVTAWHTLFVNGALRPGDVSVVLGTGGVSTSAISLARAAGARVISVVKDGSKKPALEALGSDDVLALSEYPDWPARVLSLTGGEGADIVVDVVGGANVDRSISATKPGGLVHMVGYVEGTKAEIDLFNAIRHAVILRAATAGSRSSFESLVSSIELANIKPSVADVFPVSKLDDAFAVMSRGGYLGKIVLEFP